MNFWSSKSFFPLDFTTAFLPCYIPETQTLMWHVLHLAAVPAAFLLGVFCVLTAIMMYPGEEGKIQSKFEDFWIRVDDYKQLALSRHAAFMTQVAKLETRFLDRVFGQKLISLQSVVVSACCSIASAYISLMTMIYLSVKGTKLEIDVMDLMDPWSLSVYISPLLIVAAFILAKKPIVRRILIMLAFVFVIYFAISWYVYVFEETFEETRLSGIEAASGVMLIGLLGGFISDVAFIAATRGLVRNAGQMTKFFNVAATVALTILLAGALVGPFLVSVYESFTEGPEPSKALRWANSIALTNMFDALLASLFVLLMLILLMHRVCWPLLTRTLFQMQDIGAKGRRGILLTVGLSLLGWSGVKLPELAKELLKALGKG